MTTLSLELYKTSLVKCDLMLHRLVCYIHSSHGLRLRGYVGDSADQLQLTLYSGADFAGCP
eukprot:5344589-Heterocapsa_arctica.AAC.1